MPIFGINNKPLFGPGGKPALSTACCCNQTCRAAFSWEAQTGGHYVQFTDETPGNVVAWQWDFGDPYGGSSSLESQQDPLYYYVISYRVYIVTLTVTLDTGEQCSATRFVEIGTPFECGFPNVTSFSVFEVSGLSGIVENYNCPEAPEYNGSHIISFNGGGCSFQNYVQCSQGCGTLKGGMLLRYQTDSPNRLTFICSRAVTDADPSACVGNSSASFIPDVDLAALRFAGLPFPNSVTFTLQSTPIAPNAVAPCGATGIGDTLTLTKIN